MANEFRLSGVVSDVEIKTSGRGRQYYQFSLMTAELVEGLIWWSEIGEGELIEISGIITSWNGWPRLKVQEVRREEQVRLIEQEPAKVLDDELPF